MNFGLYIWQARRWVLFVVLPTLLVSGVSYLYTAHEAKTYKASAILYVQQQSTADTTMPGSTDVQTSQEVIPTYSQMISSPIIAKLVDKRMSTRRHHYRLADHSLSVQGSDALPGQQSTQLLTITVTDTDRRRAAAGANTVGKVFIQEIVGLQKDRFKGAEKSLRRQLDLAQANLEDVSTRMNNYDGTPAGLNNLKAQLSAYQSIYQSLLASSQQFSITRDTALNGVKIFSPADTPSTPIGPHPSRSALLFGFGALLLCAAGLFAYDYLDDSPRTPEEVEEIVEAPVLGTVQQYDVNKYGTQIASLANSRLPVAEAYRVIRTNIQFTNVDKPPRTVVVTSASPSEGKSTTVSNLAQVFAEAGRRVVLVDGDLRSPSLHRIFALDRKEGLTNLLASTGTLNGHGSQPGGHENLTLVASGPTPPRPADLLGSARMGDLVQHLQGQSDMLLIDSPPILAVTDASILSTLVDGVILVVDPAKTRRRDLRRAREAIEAVGGQILGVVINRLDKRGSSYYYYYYHHNYGYQYQYSYGQEPEKVDAEA